MTDNEVKLFTYKKHDILVREKGHKFQVGISGEGVSMWFESLAYDTVKLAITSGREHARSVIDEMLLARKKEQYAAANRGR